ncbi:hypothetical protein M0R45_029564 [Rubus argutus]|uniref:Uncharacterized protein n=1 Tax=Rubus argutus TaxID=59490 RepID=A0AAW1WAE2_RUBAR
MLRNWNKSQVGDVHARVSASKVVLDSIQAEISSFGPSNDRFYREDLAQSQYLLDLSIQATFLRDKSRIRWLKDGDKNTSFLHSMVKMRRLNKSIVSLSVGQTVLNDQDSISAHVVQQFQNSFMRDPQVMDTGLVQRVIPNVVTEEENLSLLAIPSREEIHATVRAMDSFSAPGPDGFGGCFYTHCWSFIANDVVLVVQSFFQNGYILPHFNSNSLILIPKLGDSEGENATFLGAFSHHAHVSSTIDVEVLAVIEAIKEARLRDKLANYGALHDGSHWWNSLPQFLLPTFGHDYYSRIAYRFS